MKTVEQKICRMDRVWWWALHLLESAPAAPPEPTVGRLSSAPLWALCLIVLPFPCSSAVRYLTSLNMAWSLALAFLGVGTLTLLWYPRRDRRPIPTQIWLSGGLWFVLVSGLTVALFYNTRCFGLPTTGAIDSVGHLIELPRLTGPDPQVYWGMTAFHGLVYWLEVILQQNPAQAFRLVIYGQLLGVVGFVVLVQALFTAHLARQSPFRPRIWLIAVLSLAIGVYPASTMIYPMIHGYQLDGYFPHLQGLLPLFALVLIYATGHYRLHRLGGLCFGILMLRYTYYLNIIDVVVTCALVVIWEAWTAEEQKPRRWILIGLALISLGCAGYLYIILRENRTIGDIPATLVDWKIMGTAGLSLLLIAAPLLVKRITNVHAATVQRLCLFAGLYGLVAVTVQTVWRLSTPNQEYLLHKYGFSASLLVLLTAIPCLSYLLTIILTAGGRSTLYRGALAAAMVITAGGSAAALAHSVPVFYTTTFKWRLADAPSPLNPLADLYAWSLIKRVLQENGRRFGAFLAPLTVETQFAGYALHQRGALDPLPLLVPDGLMAGLTPSLDFPLVEIAQPGHCIFWLDPLLFALIPPEQELNFKRGQTVQRLHEELKACTRYPRRSFADRPIYLCYTCFEGSSSIVPLAGSSTVEFSGFYAPQTNGRWTNGKGTILLQWPLKERCSLTLQAAQEDYKVFFDGTLLQAVIPGRFGIPATLIPPIDQHTITIQSATTPSAEGPRGVMVHEISISCVKPQVPPPMHKGIHSGS